MGNKISYSPGPWVQQPDNPLVVRDERGLGICVAITDSIGEKQAWANARLCSAAPDLLRCCVKSESALREALPDVVRAHDAEHHDDRCFLCDLRAVIVQAGGAA